MKTLENKIVLAPKEHQQLVKDGQLLDSSTFITTASTNLQFSRFYRSFSFWLFCLRWRIIGQLSCSRQLSNHPETNKSQVTLRKEITQSHMSHKPTGSVLNSCPAKYWAYKDLLLVYVDSAVYITPSWTSLCHLVDMTASSGSPLVSCFV